MLAAADADAAGFSHAEVVVDEANGVATLGEGDWRHGRDAHLPATDVDLGPGADEQLERAFAEADALARLLTFADGDPELAPGTRGAAHVDGVGADGELAGEGEIAEDLVADTSGASARTAELEAAHGLSSGAAVSDGRDG